MAKRFGMFGGKSSDWNKEKLDAALDQALETIRSGDPAAGVQFMEGLTQEIHKAEGATPTLAHAFYNASVANLVAGAGSRAVELLVKASEVPAVDQESQKDRLTYLMNLGDILTRMGQLEEAEQHLKSGLEERFEFYGADHPGVAFGLTPLAANLLEQGRAAEALPLIDQAVSINGQAGQPEVATDLALRCYVVKAAGAGAALDQWDRWPHDLQLDVMRGILERSQSVEEATSANLAIEVLRELADTLNQTFSLNDRLNVLIMICNAARIAEDHASRIRYGKRAAKLALDEGDQARLVNLYEGLAMALSDAGQEDQAEKAYKSAYKVAKEVNDNEMIANVLRNYGIWCSDNDQLDQADKCLRLAVKTASESDDQEIEGRTLAAYGIFLQHQERFDLAETALQSSVDLLPAAHADRFCAMSHLIALQKGAPCPCGGEAHGEAASAIVEEIVKRSAPEGLLETLSLQGGNIEVGLSREPTPEEMEQLQCLIELAMAEIRKEADPTAFPQ